MRRSFAEILWGKQARLSYLLLASVLMLFTCLGSRELWTQEHRWSDIVYAMIYHHDFLHPRLNGVDYYDKPLLSYWFIAGPAALFGKLTTWIMRFPSALAGLLAIWSIYDLGKQIRDKRLGLLAGWMLVTTFYFIFWARTSSADMLNMAGTLFAVAWYYRNRLQARFYHYVVFFLILALTALCKGLVAPVVAAIAILPDVMLEKTWKKHLRFSLLLAMLPALLVYALPFWASAHYSTVHYQENGFMLVYRENILRYFQPFDHKGPIYTYLIFLPVYLLPWTVFFIPALFGLKSRWKTLPLSAKWVSWVVLLLFLFFTLSGSRRNYYVLPIVPFALLMTADWILAGADQWKRNIWSGRFAVLFFILFFLAFDVMQPIYYAGGGLNQFTLDLRQQTDQIKPWSQWKFVMLDPESKVRFYLGLAPEIKNYTIQGIKRHEQTQASLLQAWPFLLEATKNTDTIYISRKEYEPELRSILKNYSVIEAKPSLGEVLLKKNPNLPVAFVPRP